MAIIGPLLRLATASAAARSLRVAAAEAKTNVMLTVGLYVAAGAGVFCLGRAAQTILERHLDPAEAWAITGVLYGALGGVFYLAATRRRRT